MSRKEIILPWASVGKVILSLSEFVDTLSKERPAGLIETPSPAFGDPSVDLTECHSWTGIECDAQVQVDKDELKRVLLPGDKANTAIVCLLVITCSATKLRRAVPLSPESDGQWRGRLVLSRGEVAGTAVVKARVTRATNGIRQPGLAEKRGSLIGESGSYDLYLDEWDKPYDGQFKWSWTSFSSSDISWLKQRAADLFFVDTSKTPTVYLNLDVQDFQSVLDTKAKTGVARLMSEATALLIAQSVWQQLITEAVVSAQKDEEEDGYIIGADWKGQILRQTASIAFPETSLTEAVDNLKEAFHNSEAAYNIGIVTSIAQHLARTGRQFQRYYQIGAKVGGDS